LEQYPGHYEVLFGNLFYGIAKEGPKEYQNRHELETLDIVHELWDHKVTTIKPSLHKVGTCIITLKGKIGFNTT